jgi:transposase
MSTTNARSNRYSPEVRERAIRMAAEARGAHGSEWAAISSVAGKLGMTAETLRSWIRQAQIDEGQRAGISSEEAQRIKELERECKELRRANEILKAASAFFARELDPQLRR